MYNSLSYFTSGHIYTREIMTITNEDPVEKTWVNKLFNKTTLQGCALLVVGIMGGNVDRLTDLIPNLIPEG